MKVIHTFYIKKIFINKYFFKFSNRSDINLLHKKNKTSDKKIAN